MALTSRLDSDSSHTIKFRQSDRVTPGSPFVVDVDITLLSEVENDASTFKDGPRVQAIAVDCQKAPVDATFNAVAGLRELNVFQVRPAEVATLVVCHGGTVTQLLEILRARGGHARVRSPHERRSVQRGTRLNRQRLTPRRLQHSCP